MNKRNIFLLCAIGCLQGMVFYAPVATLYRQAVGIGIFEITVIESISLALSILLEIPWGWTADRIGYRKTMVICCVLFFLSKVVFWKATVFAGFLLERILLAVVCSGLSGVDSAMLFESCNKENSHKVFSIYTYLQQTGLVLAAGVHSLWIGTNYRLAGFLTVLSYAAAASVCVFLQEVKKPKDQTVTIKESVQVLTGQLKNRNLLLFLISVALVNETHQSITVFLNQLQYTRAGISVHGISAAYILVSLAGLASAFSFRLSGRLGEKHLGGFVILVSLLCCLVLAVTRNPILSILAVVGIRVAYSLLQPLQLEQQNRRIQTRNRATALSMNALLMNSIAVFLSVLYGSVAQVNLPVSMLLGAVLCMLSLLIYRISW